MPYPRTSTAYPASMRALIEEVAADNLGRQVTFGSPREAYSQRSRFYAFIAAVKRDLTHKPAWMGAAEAEGLRLFLNKAMTMEFLVEGPSLTIRPRDESPFADKLRGAKILPPRDGSPPPPDADAADSVLESLIRRSKP